MNFKSALKKLVGINSIHRYHILKSKIMPMIMSDERAVRRYYRRCGNGQPLNLKNPQTFSEKQQWYKLNNHLPLMECCADKHEVRSYVTACGYSELLNEQYGLYNSADELPIETLPDKFVIKATHASGWNLIVRDKASIDWSRELATIRLWLKQDIYWSGREWVYRNLPKRLVVEKYLEDDSGGLLDYKFFCFNGEPRFLQLEVGRFTSRNTRNFYDMQWTLLPFGKAMPHDPSLKIPQPECFEEMKTVARRLAQPFSFVRVDLYQVNGRIIFGELTFFPAGGAADFIPAEYDRIIGEMWDIGV